MCYTLPCPSQQAINLATQASVSNCACSLTPMSPNVALRLDAYDPFLLPTVDTLLRRGPTLWCYELMTRTRMVWLSNATTPHEIDYRVPIQPTKSMLYTMRLACCGYAYNATDMVLRHTWRPLLVENRLRRLASTCDWDIRPMISISCRACWSTVGSHASGSLVSWSMRTMAVLPADAISEDAVPHTFLN